MRNTVAVLGATGQVGRHLVQKLVARDLEVRVLSRSVAKAKKLFGDAVEIMEGDFISSKDLKSLVEGVTHLFAAHGAGDFAGERGYELVVFGGLDKALDSIPADQKTHVIYRCCRSMERTHSYLEADYWLGLTERMLQRSGHPFTILRPTYLNKDKGADKQAGSKQVGLGDVTIDAEGVAEAMVQAMRFGCAKGKIFELPHMVDGMGTNWEDFFSRPLPEEEMISLWS
ncbi:NAD(P)H-binding protein [Rufibacter hautae]|uniref:NAD(P)H-binding protein n=1 Tax=Rufibacter hautae TaxID=2595005 RepID=A0A5B6TE01_9BACT|nr:NAD(P)H-binding protein [Rufibacter hautae]KAA3438697.1 NAD(P)H-binding protein [Rufibacter hautae]